MIRVKKFLSGGPSPEIRLKLLYLYNMGYFGNIPFDKAVDGYYGPLTRAAEQRALNSKDSIRKEQELLYNAGYFGKGVSKEKAIDGRYGNLTYAAELNAVNAGKVTEGNLNSYNRLRNNGYYKGYRIKGNPNVFKQQVDLYEKGLLLRWDLDGVLGPRTRAALSNSSQKNPLSQVLQESNLKSGRVKVKANEETSSIILVPNNPVDRRGKHTTECAAYVNGILESHGIRSRGDANSINDDHTNVLNGYKYLKDDPILSKENATNQEILNFHRNAANNFKNNFDVNDLNPNKLYTVNMYYANSKHIQEFFNNSRKNGYKSYGTHAGVVYFDGRRWMVTDNIGGRVYNRPLESVLGGRGNIGITSMAKAGRVRRKYRGT